MASTWTEFVGHIEKHVTKRESFAVPMRPLPGQAALASLPNKKYDFLRVTHLETDMPVTAPSFIEFLIDGISVSRCLLSPTSLAKVDLVLQWPTNLELDASWIPIRPFHMCNIDVRITGTTGPIIPRIVYSFGQSNRNSCRGDLFGYRCM